MTVSELVKAMFEMINLYIPLFMPIVAFSGMATMIFLLASYISESIIEAVSTEEKKSYEDEMSYFDNKEAAQIDLSSGISLDDLLQPDGEIPDKFLGGSYD